MRAVDPNGNDGRLIRINPNGTQTVMATPGLIKPGGITVGPDRALCVTNRSMFAGSGEVLLASCLRRLGSSVKDQEDFAAEWIHSN